VTGVSGSGTGALGALVPTLLPLLTPIVNTLNTLITGPLSLFAGLKVAGADVTAQSMDCQAIKLSQ
jgi:hypothetical protein